MLLRLKIREVKAITGPIRIQMVEKYGRLLSKGPPKET